MNDDSRPQPLIEIKGPRFWVITATISGLCTVCSVLTVAALLAGMSQIGPLDERTIILINLGVFYVSLASGFLGLGSMILGKLKDVGRISYRGRVLAAHVTPMFCIPAYVAPWLLAFALWVLNR